MIWHVEVRPKPGQPDLEADRVRSELADFGVRLPCDLQTARGFLLSCDLNESQVQRVARELLADPVVEDYQLIRAGTVTYPGTNLLVLKKPGVMDPVEGSTLSALRDMGFEAEAVKTAKRYCFSQRLTHELIDLLAGRILANECIEQVLVDQVTVDHLAEAAPYPFKVTTFSLKGMSDEELATFSKQRTLHLSVAEMRCIQAHYEPLGRDPTDIELETIAQTWSEHCSHKTLRGKVQFGGRVIDNLLKSTIMRVTKELDKPWCVSVFADNAGIVTFDDEHCVCFKVETHNHPSAIEPYGGANTGIGGVIRDPMGTGMGAKPIANTDIFCFAPPDTPLESLPRGVLHPKKVMKGVVAGVRDYGNRMGIPTVNGAVLFDPRYLGNPLVYCGNIGLLPKDGCFKHASPGDLVVAVGGRTGRDGIHGATFSSVELTEESDVVDGGAVQIGNAITEKKMLDTLLVARDAGLYSAIWDCGAGGFSSAVGETGAEIGAEVDLDAAPLKYEGLSYTEIWISEAQERMVLAVPPENLDRIMQVFASEDVEATVIGRYTDTGRLVLRYQGQLVGELDMTFLHEGQPQVVREAVYTPPELPPLHVPDDADLGDALQRILSAWNVCSKEWVVRQYDHEVQGGSVVKPLVGRHDDGPSDAAVFRPVLDSCRGLAVANGINPRYGDLDPYHMAASAIDEAVRNCVAVGARPDRICLLDNFCWGNTDRPETLGPLVRAAEACYDIAVAYGTPFVSGKDSLNNEFATEAGTIVIPSTLLISALGLVDDVRRCVTMDFKEPGNAIYVIGLTRDELGGSHYAGLFDQRGGHVPQVHVDLGVAVFQAVHRAITQGCVRACHDLSEGGLAVSLAEMAFAGATGARVALDAVPVDGDLDDARRLFSESNSRFAIEVQPERRQAFEQCVAHVPVACIGEVTDTGRLQVDGVAGRVIDLAVDDLKRAWQQPLRW